MPNWCENRLRIIAKTDTARALLPRLEAGFDERVGGSVLDVHAFDVILPMPDELRGRNAPESDEAKAKEFLAKYGAADWYDWSLNNWGTKWPSVNLGVEREGDTLTTEFQTAWSPPMGIYARLQELGFDVLATFAEQGCDFAGFWRNGEELAIKIEWGNRDDDESHGLDDYEVVERTFASLNTLTPVPIPTEMYPCGLGG